MRPRRKRSEERIALANWERDVNRRKFIENLLIKQGVPVSQNTCPSLMEHGVRCILKDFKRMGSGGVGLVWACVLCRSGEETIENMSGQAISQGKLGPFNGSCRYAITSGDANKLVILPSYTNKLTPRALRTDVQGLETSKGIMERVAFRVLTKS